MKALFSIGILLVLSINLLSQGLDDNLMMQIANEHNLYGLLQSHKANMVYIEQIGDMNKAIVNQQGSNNKGQVIQQGNQLTITLNQTGNSNKTNSWSVGQNIDTEIYQTGNHNVVRSYVENHDLLTKFTSITQTGDHLEITTKQGVFSPSLIINQHSGFFGQGMKVNVSHSDFYLPMKE